VVFRQRVEGFFLNHSDFLANFEDLNGYRQDPGLERGRTLRVRLTRAPGVSIALIMGRATGTAARSRSPANDVVSRERRCSRVGSGRRPGRWRGPMSRLPRRWAEDARWKCSSAPTILVEIWPRPMAMWNRRCRTPSSTVLDALARRIAAFDKWAIANTKRLLNASTAADVEIAAGVGTPAWPPSTASTQATAQGLFRAGFHKPGEAEDRLGAYLGRLAG